MLNFANTNFTVNGDVLENKLNMTMKVFQKSHINTRNIPATIPVLSQDLPSIFKCQCFNDQKKNFREESEETELGHLFEHVMLEHLCMEKLASGAEEAIYEGVTKWNWTKETPGTFNIEITAGIEDLDYIRKAFDRSISLLTKILS